MCNYRFLTSGAGHHRRGAGGTVRTGCSLSLRPPLCRRINLLRYQTFARPGLRRAGILAASTALTLALALPMAPKPARAATPPQVPGNLDAARLLGADNEPQN